MADRLSVVGYGDDYGSEFDESETKKTWRDDNLSGLKRKQNAASSVPSKTMVMSEYSREEGKNQRFHFLGLDAYSRHKKMINDYLLYYGPGVEHYKRDCSRDKTDYDIIKQEHRFLWDEDEDTNLTWEKQLARKYYDKLFKEYCISDLSRYKENKFAMRWRIEKEVVEGKGQFICGNKKCNERDGLRSWEVNFSYIEHNEKKNALVKLRLCPDCSYKLNYHHKRKLAKQKTINEKKKERRDKKSKKHKKKAKRHRDQHDTSSESADSSDSGTDNNKSGTSSKDKQSESGEESGASTSHVAGEDIWKGPAKLAVDKTRDEEFEDYFQDLFL
ncbi:protein FRA10AC1 homolog [Nematostella vectensis]|uniref:protein FRA10AC1 homolog n=1 Tax=Nematostella vectensis TaxID=45351 RepID=UPI0013906812|nr:protein FRA10AC1 homolog [Nematostella vectensis]